MARRNYYKPWPHEAGTPYRELVKEQDLILRMIKDSLKEGVIEASGVTEFNPFVFERMIPRIIKRAEKIQVECRDIASLLEDDRRGRLPKWYTTALDIHAKAMTIIQLLEEEALPALARNELPYIKKIFLCLENETKGIKKMLDINPWRPGLEVWGEMAEKVRKAFEE